MATIRLGRKQEQSHEAGLPRGIVTKGQEPISRPTSARGVGRSPPATGCSVLVTSQGGEAQAPLTRFDATLGCSPRTPVVPNEQTLRPIRDTKLTLCRFDGSVACLRPVALPLRASNPSAVSPSRGYPGSGSGTVTGPCPSRPLDRPSGGYAPPARGSGEPDHPFLVVALPREFPRHGLGRR